MAAIILACLLPISCGHNSRQSAGLEETDVAESDSEGGLMPVPVYSIYGLQFALMNRDTDELVLFDNDEDYSGYCAFFGFVGSCDVAFYEYEKVFGIDKTVFYKDFEQNHKVCDTVYNFHLSLINAVMDYLGGNKDKIKDRKLFTRIDKAFYDNHPDQGYYYLKRSEYGHKYYYSTNDKMSTVHARASNLDDRLHDGTELPEGTLVFSFNFIW